MEIIVEKSNYIVIKALTEDELDSEIYMSDIINNIILLIQNKQQKNILFTISRKIFLETVNDSFWLGIILSVEDKITNYGMKYILSDFLFFFSSIFCEETVKYKFGQIKDEKYLSGREIKKLRKYI